MIIAISEGRLHITFRVCDDRTVELADISLGERAPLSTLSSSKPEERAVKWGRIRESSSRRRGDLEAKKIS